MTIKCIIPNLFHATANKLIDVFIEYGVVVPLAGARKPTPMLIKSISL